MKVRIIPTLLWKEFGLVKGVKFDSWRRVGSVLPAIKVYNQREVDELILVDILAHSNCANPDYESISEFCNSCFVPITVGGGIKNIQQVNCLLRAGADKISINTSAYAQPNLVNDIAKHHGTQCIVASVDVRKVDDCWICFSNSGQISTNINVLNWVKELEDRGAGEILLTSIDRDGTMSGYDLPLIEAVVGSVSIPIIASGGAGNYHHMVEAVTKVGASAVAAASMFHFTEQTPAEAKTEMKKAGIPVRRTYYD